MTTTGSVPAISAPLAGVSGPNAGAPMPAMADPGLRTPFTWVGSPWSLAGTCCWNMLLTVLTLGIYGFWGRTEIRRRLWSSVRLHGEPLAYHGTPQELLRGFFAVLVAVLIPLFIVGTIVVVFFGQASAVFGLYQGGLFAVVYPILAAVAFYRARRYRLTRTSWRGLRGSLGGSSSSYSAFSWLTMCAYPFTLGWIAPYRAVELQRIVVNETTLGNARLHFDGRSAPMYKRYTLLWIGTLVLWFGVIGVAASTFNKLGAQPFSPIWFATLRGSDVAKIIGVAIGAVIVWSLMSSFYYARLYNYLAHATLIGQGGSDPSPVRFHLDVTGKRIIWLFVTNALITYFSLYILKPVATARAMKYYTEHLSIIGPFDPSAIAQNPNAVSSAGEGLAQAFDLDAF